MNRLPKHPQLPPPRALVIELDHIVRSGES